MDRRKLESAALFLTLFGALLFLPPLTLLFHHEMRLFGVPVELSYLFGVWMALVLLARWLGRRLPQDPGEKDLGGKDLGGGDLR